MSGRSPNLSFIGRLIHPAGRLVRYTSAEEDVTIKIMKCHMSRSGGAEIWWMFEYTRWNCIIYMVVRVKERARTLVFL